MSAKTIAVFTGTRAEYGLLRGIIKTCIKQGCNVQLIVTGAHLSPDYGLSVQEIEADGFPIYRRIDMQLGNDTPETLARGMGMLTEQATATLLSLAPDIAIILGDRYEMLAAASACLMASIPIAHIHGGEITEGAMDEMIRHAITKLSYLHFVSHPTYAENIVRMGEEPSRVFTVGAPGIDALASARMSRAELEKSLGIMLTSPCFLITYHPETLGDDPLAQVNELLAALDRFPDAQLIFTGANADHGGRVINQCLQKYAAQRQNAYFFMSLGQARYHAMMHHADLLIGNSSSGILEAPVINKTVVNIGDRQKGRIRAPHVIDCACRTADIMHAITHARALHLAPFTAFGSPGKVAPAITDVLVSTTIPKPARKIFYCG